MKRVLWIADMSTADHPGGAQRTDQLIIQHARTIGIHVTELNYYRLGLIKTILSDKYDIIITGNIFLFSQIPGFLSWIAKQNNHIRFEHDANNHLSYQDRYTLYKNNKLSIFLSQEHYQFFVDHHGSYFKDIPCRIVSSPISKDFYDYEQIRGNTLWAGLLHPLKGLKELKDFARTGQPITISAIGNFALINDILALSNVNFVGKTEYEDIPKLYNEHATLLYAPGQPEPFCRTVAEALLCGMDIDTCNSPHKIGALELFNRVGRKQFTHMCHGSPKLFWEIIDEQLTL